MIRSKFDSVRFIIPNIAKSAATLLCLSGDEILMNEQSELGPVDPQMPLLQPNGQVKYSPSHLVIQQFQSLIGTMKTDPSLSKILAPYLHLYFPSVLQECHNARGHVQEVAKRLLENYMFKGQENGTIIAERIAENLSNFSNFLSHGRPININYANELGLNIMDMRKDEKLNGYVNLAYISIVETFNRTQNFVKLIENNKGHGTIISM